MSYQEFLGQFHNCQNRLHNAIWPQNCLNSIMEQNDYSMLKGIFSKFLFSFINLTHYEHFPVQMTEKCFAYRNRPHLLHNVTGNKTGVLHTRSSSPRVILCSQRSSCLNIVKTWKKVAYFRRTTNYPLLPSSIFHSGKTSATTVHKIHPLVMK
jgi:hypothetical protein